MVTIASILAARSDFSLGESTMSPDTVVKLAKAAGQTAVALTDTMSVTSMIGFSTAAKDAGLKPIIGARLRISENALWRPSAGEKKKHMPPAYFITYYVRSAKGLQALFRLLSLANTEEYFYYNAKLGWGDVVKELDTLTAEDYAIVLGDEQGIYQHAYIDQIMLDIATCNYAAYLPFVAVNTPYYGAINKRSLEYADKHKLPLLALRPALYDVEGADAQEVLAAICEGTKADAGYFRSRFNRDLHPVGLTDLVKEITLAAKHLLDRGVPNAGIAAKSALANTAEFVDQVTYVWDKLPPNLPRLAADEYAEVVSECRKGFLERFKRPKFGHVPTAKEQSEVYIPRLKYELSVLKKLGFSAYFLTVQEIVKYAKDNGIQVGPGRGSVGGSLVAYLMGITDIDPIRFNLLFERFINPERIDLPDADLDFMSSRRQEIINHLIAKFGADRVAGVSNFTTLGASSAIRDVGRTFGIPEKDYSCSKFVPKLHGQPVDLATAAEEVGEIEAFASANPGIWSIMQSLEGCNRSFSQHAAGIVVSNDPLTNFAVVEKRSKSAVVNWDKRVIEDQGLVKMDILGLTTLDVIGGALRYIEESTGIAVAIDEIPLDDPNVLAAFARADTAGVFQFESGGMRKLLKDMGTLTGTVTFDDITAATALYRPGPMESGMMESYAKRKQGEESISYDHPLMEPILKETLGTIVYQEQVMKISQVIAGYTGPEADKLRKIMGKKQPDEMAKQLDKFVNGAVATIGCDPTWAKTLFDKIAQFAGYGFNKSHAAAYTLISYQSMWLKVNYPVEFYASTMSALGEDKMTGLMRDAKANGVGIIFPDINKSSDRYEIDRAWKSIIVPFQRVKGISTKSAGAILAARAAGPFKSKEDFIARVNKTLCNVRVQDALDRVGAFASIEPTQPSANDPCRIKDQTELMSSLVSDYVPIGREMPHDKETISAVVDLVDEYRAAHGPGGSSGATALPVKPAFGKNASIMVVVDAPNSYDEGAGIIGYNGYDAVHEAMTEADLTMADVYMTSLIKRPRAGRQVSGDEITTWKPYFLRELEIVKPTAIVLLGSQAVRTMMPTFKGKAFDAAGDVLYFKDIDANVVMGFAPGEIFYSPEKQDAMNKVFAVAKELIS